MSGLQLLCQYDSSDEEYNKEEKVDKNDLKLPQNFLTARTRKDSISDLSDTSTSSSDSEAALLVLIV